MAKRAKRGDDPYADLKERVIRLEKDMQWIKKIVWRDHYLIISSLVGIVLTILAVLLK
jgi:hypothetical protein